MSSSLISSPVAVSSIAALCLLITACSPADETADCFVADTVVINHNESLQKAGFSLVTRQSGFAEKVEFLELYRGQATFSDECKTTEAELLDKVFIDEEEGLLVKVVIDDEKLSVVHDSDKPAGPGIPADFLVDLQSR